ncbi:hypothetical protein GOHSU_59_00090 [Gordonia hirsuta DSM 44140 = NBRC 16056]|uniref:DUF308 domain-containing protein n=1 Tax=Gordonia hirsuta DSM 44140 = NBRC 16056 TaxID=1121927 RepID=L7LDT8_9ACTN|nr:DUF308 domain-containing protein [Gordonia hirsuta]GAC58916.1 hypothetical protein GOHSU_59_00090 [Gordonia hirsuta DSM 44140 = NBRC 16056]
MINQQVRLGLPAEAVNAVRSGLLFSAVVGIVLGVLIMVLPGLTVFVAGLLFGIALIVAGLYRLFFSFAAVGLSFALRALMLVLGILMVVCGVVAVISPEDAWWMLAIFIGVGWIFGGFQDIFGSVADAAVAPRWLVIVGGVISVAAGIVMLVYSPGVTLPAIMWLMGLLLVIVSVVTLVTLPKKVPTAATD